MLFNFHSQKTSKRIQGFCLNALESDSPSDIFSSEESSTVFEA